MPITLMPYSFRHTLATERMAALRPGQSPPEVRMPMHLVLDLDVMEISERDPDRFPDRHDDQSGDQSERMNSL
jgi:hypothetical protein